jgi:putative transposase
MDKRHLNLTDDARRALEQAELASKDVEERRHIQAVRLYGTGEGLATIIQVVQASERTIGRWVKRYQEGGLAGLARRAQPGNHRTLSQAEWEAVVSVLKETTPAGLGLSERQDWTVSDTARLVRDRYGAVYVGRSRYHALLHAAGLSYQRATKVYRHQPSAAVISDWEADTEKK